MKIQNEDLAIKGHPYDRFVTPRTPIGLRRNSGWAPSRCRTDASVRRTGRRRVCRRVGQVHGGWQAARKGRPRRQVVLHEEQVPVGTRHRTGAQGGCLTAAAATATAAATAAAAASSTYLATASTGAAAAAASSTTRATASTGAVADARWVTGTARESDVPDTGAGAAASFPVDESRGTGRARRLAARGAGAAATAASVHVDESQGTVTARRLAARSPGRDAWRGGGSARQAEQL